MKSWPSNFYSAAVLMSLLVTFLVFSQNFYLIQLSLLKNVLQEIDNKKFKENFFFVCLISKYFFLFFFSMFVTLQGN